MQWKLVIQILNVYGHNLCIMKLITSMFWFCCVLLTIFWAVVIVCTAHFNIKVHSTVFHALSLALFDECICFSEEITTVYLMLRYVCNGYAILYCAVYNCVLKVFVRPSSPYKGLNMCHIQSIFRGILMKSTSYHVS